jgi:hypothetical protein
MTKAAKEERALFEMTRQINAFTLCVRNIASMPLEDWIVIFEKIEQIGSLEPDSRYEASLRNVANYLGHEKMALLKEFVTLALPLKQAVVKVQAQRRPNTEVENYLDSLGDPKGVA